MTAEEVQSRTIAALEQLKAAILAAEDWDIPMPVARALNSLIRNVVPELVAEVKTLQVDATAAKILADHDLKTERAHADRWQKLAGAYDDIRYALRNAPDTPEGHAEFYNEADRLIFGDAQ